MTEEWSAKDLAAYAMKKGWITPQQALGLTCNCGHGTGVHPDDCDECYGPPWCPHNIIIEIINKAYRKEKQP